jgi:hypothetical protein
VTDKYEVENKLLDCFYSHQHEIGVEIESLVDSLEQIFIDYDILESSSGESYIKFIKSVGDSGYVPNKFASELKEEFSNFEYIPSGVFCMDSSLLIDTVSFHKSKVKFLYDIFEIISSKGDISASLISDEILKVFSAKDFENKFYKTVGIIMLTNVYNLPGFEPVDFGRARELPPLDSKEYKPTQRGSVFSVLVNAKDMILADGRVITVEELKPMVKKFILENPEREEIEFSLIGTQSVSNGVVSLKYDSGTSYEMFLSVQEEIKTAFKETRNDYSMQFFNVPFEELEKEKKEIIKKLVPIRIYESEP